MNIILLGSPGSGKSTQGKFLSQKLGVPLLASGDVSRQLANENTDEGALAREAISSGGLTPDDILFRRTRQIIDKLDVSKGIIFDSYPRNESQIFPFEKMLEEKGMVIDKVILINLPREIGTQRMLARAKLENRVDDNPETIAKRYQVFEEETMPIIEYYRQKGKLAEINGDDSVENVGNKIWEAVRND